MVHSYAGRCQPLLQSVVHARLPALAGGLESRDFVGVLSHRYRKFRADGDGPPTPDKLVTQVLIGPLEKFVGQFRRVVRIYSSKVSGFISAIKVLVTL